MFDKNIMKTSSNFFFLACLTSTSCLTQAAAVDLKLKCDGTGSKSNTETTIKTNRNSKEDSKEIGTEQAMVKEGFKGNVFVEIDQTEGKVKLPVAMLPPFQKDEASDWFPINDMNINDAEISGEIRINFLNKPEITIDRMTGSIIIVNSLNEFSGDCSKLDENAQPVF